MTDLEKVTLSAKLDYEGGLDALLTYGKPITLMKKYPEFAKLVKDYENAANALSEYLYSEKSEEDFEEAEFNQAYADNWQ